MFEIKGKEIKKAITNFNKLYPKSITPDGSDIMLLVNKHENNLMFSAQDDIYFNLIEIIKGSIESPFMISIANLKYFTALKAKESACVEVDDGNLYVWIIGEGKSFDDVKDSEPTELPILTCNAGLTDMIIEILDKGKQVAIYPSIDIENTLVELYSSLESYKEDIPDFNNYITYKNGAVSEFAFFNRTSTIYISQPNKQQITESEEFDVKIDKRDIFLLKKVAGNAGEEIKFYKYEDKIIATGGISCCMISTKELDELDESKNANIASFITTVRDKAIVKEKFKLQPFTEFVNGKMELKDIDIISVGADFRSNGNTFSITKREYKNLVNYVRFNDAIIESITINNKDFYYVSYEDTEINKKYKALISAVTLKKENI